MNPVRQAQPRTRLGQWANRHPWFCIILLVLVSNAASIGTTRYFTEQSLAHEQRARIAGLAATTRDNCEDANRTKQGVLEFVGALTMNPRTLELAAEKFPIRDCAKP